MRTNWMKFQLNIWSFHVRFVDTKEHADLLVLRWVFEGDGQGTVAAHRVTHDAHPNNKGTSGLMVMKYD